MRTTLSRQQAPQTDVAVVERLSRDAESLTNLHHAAVHSRRLSLRGCTAVASVELSKLARQLKVHVLVAVLLLGPFAFAVTMRIQSSLPTDTLFGRAANESGFATSLVILGFAALWAFPVIASIVGGDVFSAEDRYGTWTMVLSRSRSRIEVFIGKTVVALGFTTLCVALIAASSIAAGVLVIGAGPIIDLSGTQVPPADALTRTVVAWTTSLLPALGFTAMAILVSVATRSSAAGIGLPVVIGLLMQLAAFVDGPEWMRHVLLSSAFGAWHGLLTEPAFYRPLVYATAVSSAYVVVALAIACRLVLRRDVGR